jgi:hypothetical protein
MRIKSKYQAIRFLRHLEAGRIKDAAPIHYGEMAKVVNSHPHAMGWALGHIQDACEELELPPLQALVINKKTKEPGDSYNHADHPYDPELSCYVRSYPWDFEMLINHIKGS